MSSTAHQRWLERELGPRTPEIDYGTTWTTGDVGAGSVQQWRVSYDSGLGELIAVRRDTNDIEVLGSFATRDDVDQALGNWGELAPRPGSLDLLREQLNVCPLHRNAVFGVVIEPDGTTTALHEVVTIEAAQHHVGTSALDVTRVRHETSNHEHPLVMWLADNGHVEQRPVNPVATCLYGTGWPIVGTVVVVDDNQAPLPARLVSDLDITDARDIDPTTRDPGAPLDYEDHHNDRDREPRCDWDLQ